MSLLPNVTRANQNTFIAGIGGGGGGTVTPNPAFSTVTIEGPLNVFPSAPADAVSQFYISTTTSVGPVAELAHLAPSNARMGIQNVDGAGAPLNQFQMYDLGNGSESGLIRYDGLAITSQIRFFSSFGGGLPAIQMTDGLNTQTFVNGSTITTNLQTTTINGLAYPPSAGYPITRVLPSNDTAGSWSLPTGGTPVQISQNFALTAGHTYRVSAFLNCLNGEASTSTTGGVFTGDTGSPFLLYSQLNSVLTPANNGGATTYTALVKSTVSGNGSIIMVNNGTTTLTTISQSIPGEGFLVEDLGTGLF